jgi:uncharacterized PurR-regulated membrane protein YhhQ (DUF165 family)
MNWNRTARRYGAAVAFIAAVVAANWLTSEFGFVPVGFGLVATAGTYAAGFALVARDGIHDALGLRGVAVAILVASLLSYLLADPRIAVASYLAFTLSEIADTFVYAPLRARRWRTAVVLSSIVGATIDTVVFLGVAFGTAAITSSAVAGQLVGKVLWVAVPVAVVGGILRARRPRNLDDQIREDLGVR